MVRFLCRHFEWISDLFRSAALRYDICSPHSWGITEKVLAVGLQAYFDHLQGVEKRGVSESIWMVTLWGYRRFHYELQQRHVDVGIYLLAATLPEDIYPWHWTNQAQAKFRTDFGPEKRIELSTTFFLYQNSQYIRKQVCQQDYSFHGMSVDYAMRL
jgi:hypothetical protein